MDSEEVRPDLDSAWPIAPIQTIRLTKPTKIKVLIFETRVVPFLVVVLESSTTDKSGMVFACYNPSRWSILEKNMRLLVVSCACWDRNMHLFNTFSHGSWYMNGGKHKTE